MKKTVFIIALLSTLCGYGQQTGRLVVTVRGIQTAKGGDISAGLFTKDNFPKTGQQVKGIVAPVTAEQMQVVFDQVPAGTYGVAVYQDIDRDHKLRTNLVGYPTEPIGFSRDARIRLGPPSFGDAQLTITAGQTLTTTITLR